MAFNGNEGEQITLQEAIAWTANFRSANPAAIKAHAVGKNTLNSILNQSECVGVRLYNAIDDDGAACIVIVGVNSSEQDLTSGIIIERLPPCPPYCDSASPLVK